MARINKKIGLLIGALLCAFFIKAQQSPKPYLLHWTEKDGLSDNNVYGVVKDQKGWLWIGSSNGLCRFDGKEFVTFRYDPKDKNSVGANEVVRLTKTQNGNIWVGTDGGGLSVYDYKQDDFKTLRQNLDDPDQGLMENRVFNITEITPGEIAVGYRAIGSGRGGLTFISEDLNIQKHVLQDVADYAGFPMKVTRLLKDTRSAETYWLGGRSFFKWNRTSNQVEEFPHPTFSPNHTSINGIFEASDSTLLVGLYFDGLWLFDKKRSKWLRKVHDLPIRSFLYEKDNKIWIVDSKGIGWIDLKNNSVVYKIKLKGEESPFEKGIVINSIFLINSNLWICTNKGLYCWSYIFQQFNISTLKNHKDENTLSPEFIGQITSNEWLFLDQKNGLFLTDSLLQVKEVFSTPNDLSLNLRKVDISKNKKDPIVIIGGKQGLLKWQASDPKIRPFQIKQEAVDLDKVRTWSIYMDDQDNAWLGTQARGLIKINLKTNQVKQFLHQTDNPLSLCHDKFLFEIDQDQKGNLWVCTDKGISVLNPKTEKFIAIPALDPIQNYVIHCVESDAEQNIWIGTRDQGLFKYNVETAQLKNYTAVDGLLYNGVNKMVREDSILWLATRQGLCKINTQTEEVVGFDQKKGLYSNTLYTSKLHRLPNKQLMLTYPYSSYFSTFKNSSLKAYFTPPDLVINSIRILSTKEDKKLIAIDKKNIALGPYENYFAIDFKSIHFFQPRDIHYQYQLVGYDENWIKAGNSNTAIYTNIPGGKYQFKVKAASQDRIWSKTKTINIQLQSPWYKTSWFYLFSTALIGLLIFVIYKYRTNQILKEEDFKRQLAETEMKALRSQINPHFIFNCLNSIKRYIIENRIEDGTEFVGHFSRLIRMILNHSKERLIPIAKEIEAVRLYTWLEQERLQHKFNVEYILNFSDGTGDLLIPPLLFQPYIENAIWHGLMNLQEKGNLKIIIDELADNIAIQILDDGIGRVAALEMKRKSVFSKPSLGMDLASHRLEQINTLYQLQASIQIEDQFPDRVHTGTIVKIIFPKIKRNNHAAGNHR